MIGIVKRMQKFLEIAANAYPGSIGAATQCVSITRRTSRQLAKTGKATIDEQMWALKSGLQNKV